MCTSVLSTSHLFPADPPESNGAYDTVCHKRCMVSVCTYVTPRSKCEESAFFSQIALAISCCSESM